MSIGVSQNHSCDWCGPEVSGASFVAAARALISDDVERDVIRSGGPRSQTL